jgi:hypothetical protein
MVLPEWMKVVGDGLFFSKFTNQMDAILEYNND